MMSMVVRVLVLMVAKVIIFTAVVVAAWRWGPGLIAAWS